tara:strand:+ start:463 stop:981 length:519 start_codon:yes stop_codon:yes gene_type:complete
MSNFVVNPYWYVISETSQEQLQQNFLQNAKQSGQAGVGLYLATADALGVGSKLISYTTFVTKQGSPTGTIYCKVYNSDSLKTTATTTYDASSISSSPTLDEKAFSFDGSYTLADGDFILMWYDEGDSSNYLQAGAYTSDVYDGTDSVLGYQHDDTFKNTSGWDPTFKMTYSP